MDTLTFSGVRGASATLPLPLPPSSVLRARTPVAAFFSVPTVDGSSRMISAILPACPASTPRSISVISSWKTF